MIMPVYPTLLFRATPPRTGSLSVRYSHCAAAQSDALRGAWQLPHSRLKKHSSVLRLPCLPKFRDRLPFRETPDNFPPLSCYSPRSDYHNSGALPPLPIPHISKFIPRHRFCTCPPALLHQDASSPSTRTWIREVGRACFIALIDHLNHELQPRRGGDAMTPATADYPVRCRPCLIARDRLRDWKIGQGSRRRHAC